MRTFASTASELEPLLSEVQRLTTLVEIGIRSAPVLAAIEVQDVEGGEDILRQFHTGLDEAETWTQRMLVLQCSAYLATGLHLNLEAAMVGCGWPEPVRKKLLQQFDRGLNVDASIVAEYLGLFDPALGAAWRAHTEQALPQGKSARSTLLGAMKNDRNKIAHGSGVNVNPNRLAEYSECARDAVQWIATELQGWVEGQSGA